MSDFSSSDSSSPVAPAGGPRAGLPAGGGRGDSVAVGEDAEAEQAAKRLAVAVEADERAGRLTVGPGPLAQAVAAYREAAEAAGWIEVE